MNKLARQIWWGLGGIVFIMTTVIVGLVGWNRIARRSGVKDRDLSRVLPGDSLIQNPQMVMDRATSYHASAKDIWPWIVQLGKERGGWYVPAWLERFTRGSALSGIHKIDDQFQQLAMGDFVPDYGPGSPVFKVITLEPPHVLVYLSLRDPSANWTWPQSEDALPNGTMGFSWALVLEEIGDNRCRLYIRLRGKRQGNRFRRVLVSCHARAWRCSCAIKALRRWRGSPRSQGVRSKGAKGVIAQTLRVPEPQAALLTGILLGDDSGIPKSMQDTFRTTGTSYIIAISGQLDL